MFYIIFLILFIVYLLLHLYKTNDKGYRVLNLLNDFETKYLLQCNSEEAKEYIMTNPKIINKIRKEIGNNDYIFEDYILTIENSKITTCHRDENGKYFNKKTKHNGYTIIFYLEPTKVCLDVINGSHKFNLPLYFINPIENIKCSPGNAILFNSDIFHKGNVNTTCKRLQMKLRHKDDEFPNNQKNFNKKLKNKLENNKVLSFMSCQAPIVSDLTKNGKLFYNYNFLK